MVISCGAGWLGERSCTHPRTTGGLTRFFAGAGRAAPRVSRPRRLALIAIALAAVAAPAYADDMGVCLKADGNVAIAGCTRAIESKRFRGGLLALAFGQRGLRHRLAKEYDLALADYDRAIEIDPRSAVAYLNRAALFLQMGDRARATADYRQALALPPIHGDGQWVRAEARKGLDALERGP
jgi:tetratricopeptide (TPR) repeat protein